MNRGLTTLVVSCLVLTGCTGGTPSTQETVTSGPPDRCQEVEEQAEEWQREIDTWQDQLAAIASEEFLTLEEQDWERENPDRIFYQVMATLQLIIDNPDCFSPGGVAEAKTALERLKEQR